MSALSALTETVFKIEQKLVTGDEYQISDPSGSLLANVRRSGLNFTFDTADGVRIGEIQGNQTDIKLPEYTLLYEFQILDEKSALLAKVKLKAFPHQRTGFLKNAAWSFDYSWSLEGPAGKDLARINRGGVSDSLAPIASIELTSGTVIARFDRKALSHRSNCTVQILDPSMSVFLVLATLFANPPSVHATPHAGGHHEEFIL